LILANHLDVPVVPLSDYGRDAPFAVRYFSEVEVGAFSAGTIFDGPRRTIVHNDSHSPGRQAGNLTHELGHALLLHPPAPALDDRGCRLWNQNIEDEAQWLAGAMLVTEDAALWIARGGMSLSEAALNLGVSEQMVTYRLNVTGARTRVARGTPLADRPVALGERRGAGLRAVVNGVFADRPDSDVLRNAPLPPGTHAGHLSVWRRGNAELRTWIHNGARGRLAEIIGRFPRARGSRRHSVTPRTSLVGILRGLTRSPFLASRTAPAKYSAAVSAVRLALVTSPPPCTPARQVGPSRDSTVPAAQAAGRPPSLHGR
jgi:IrrE N-terminal-like domain